VPFCFARTESEAAVSSQKPLLTFVRSTIRRLHGIFLFHRRKLLKAFYNEKKQQFDISKVPDIYDSAKYDAIHNSELGLDLQPLYTVRPLARSLLSPSTKQSPAWTMHAPFV
jgi:hypothetical protein